MENHNNDSSSPPKPKRGRPIRGNGKEAVKIRIDKDVLAHFRGGGRGWQTRINAALRSALTIDKCE